MNSRNRFQYPSDWREAALALKEICGWCCMECGIQCRKPGEKFDGWERTLTVAHYFHDYTGPEIYVACLCLKCHFAHDASHSWKARQRAYRLRAWMAGQLTLDGLQWPLQIPFNT